MKGLITTMSETDGKVNEWAAQIRTLYREASERLLRLGILLGAEPGVGASRSLEALRDPLWFTAPSALVVGVPDGPRMRGRRQGSHVRAPRRAHTKKSAAKQKQKLAKSAVGRKPPALHPNLRIRVLQSIRPSGRSGRTAMQVLEDLQRTSSVTTKRQVTTMLRLLVSKDVIRTRGHRGAFKYVMAFASAPGVT